MPAAEKVTDSASGPGVARSFFNVWLDAPRLLPEGVPSRISLSDVTERQAGLRVADLGLAVDLNEARQREGSDR